MNEAVPIAEVAAGAPLDPRFDLAGVPQQPVVLVDLEGCAALSPSDRARAAQLLRRAVPVTVGLATATGPAHEPVLEALSTTLVAQSTGSAQAALPAWDRRVVAVPDVTAAAADLLLVASAAPRASVALGRLLRQTAVLPASDGLAAESAVYSTLLAGPEFGRWLTARRPPRPPVDGGVRVARTGDVVTVTLDRPARRNAVDAATRDALCEALALLAADPAVRVELRGAGSDFSAGGDLNEFGSAPDPATAHIVRIGRSAGALIAADADRVTAYVQGACFGAGCELPVFAGRVIAAPGSRFALPELRLGLIPGAGGTVSLTARVGRWRTAWLALTGAVLDTATAAGWGLVDEVARPEGGGPRDSPRGGLGPTDGSGDGPPD